MDLPGLQMTPMVSPLSDPTALATHASASNARATAEAAKGFESLFANLLVKEMRQSLDQDTMFGQDQGEVLGGLFDFYMGQHLAQAGKLGIGAMINKQLTARNSHDNANTQTTTAAGHATGSTLQSVGR